MSTVPNDVPTTLDLAPLLELRPQVDAMVARLKAGERPDEAEAYELELRCHAAERAFGDRLTAAMEPLPPAHVLEAETGPYIAAALITGSLELEEVCERVYALERGERVLLDHLRHLAAQGEDPQLLRRSLATATATGIKLGDPYSEGTLRKAEAIIAEVERGTVTPCN